MDENDVSEVGKYKHLYDLKHADYKDSMKKFQLMESDRRENRSRW